MCYCWNFDKNGRVTGICTDPQEIRRRIDDPTYMPGLKAIRRKMSEERRQHFASLSPERKEELRREWMRVIVQTKTSEPI